MHIRHGFFGRRGGVSVGAFSGLNCSLSNGDEASKVDENRSRAAAALGATASQLVFVKQVHSSRALVVDAPIAHDSRPEADGLATRTPGLALSLLTADCAPILLCDPHAGVVGAAHAGWRGAVDGVVEATLDAMASLGADPARTSAGVGPMIGPSSFEVGPEVVDTFLDASPWVETLIRPGDGDRSFIDLGRYLLGRLTRSGVKSVDILDEDTFAEPDTYFSHRAAVRAGAATAGRNLSAIMIL
ncbi:peptidoglycan editing factor PgeF [bacterium]|nr:peptidoglycan editing factor PgeF [bacterium]